ncbi:MAG: lipopolysaccharide heptosyltransferase II [Magnetococcales bacterium]|nr:lipopolysaccharide heptosyltransferase II [Magnetococcales bacterium]
MTSDQAILIIGPSWVGDMVMAQALFKTVQTLQPHTPIDLVAPAWALPLAQRMPEIRQGIPLPLGHGQLGLATRYRLGRQLQGRYQQAILLPNSFKSALLPLFAAIPKRTGFLGEWRWGLLNDIRRLDKQQLPRTVDRFVALGLPPETRLPAAIPLPALSAHLEQGAAILKHHGLPSSGPLLALCPGAEYGAAKQWPVRHFATLATGRINSGWRVVVLGSAKEQELGQAILSDLPPAQALNLAGRIPLEQAVDVLALADAVVTNDSGLMHVAAALNRPGVALFGSSDPRHTPPLGSSLRVVSLNLPCAPCFARRCPEGHTRCLEQITPEQVNQWL